MLIIFDLDRTLIDTSKSIVPIKLKDALTVMQAKGLKISNFQNALKEILEINQKSKHGSEAIQRYCELYGRPQLAEHGIKEYYQNIDVSNIPISLVNGAEQLIQNLATTHTLAIVTYGQEAQQLQKIKSANLNASLFQKIYVTPLKNKGQYYQKLMQEFNSTPKNTIVIGDSLQIDVMPAKQLGVHAVHFQNGRTKNIKYDENTSPSFSIKSLKEVIDIVKLCKQ